MFILVPLYFLVGILTGVMKVSAERAARREILEENHCNEKPDYKPDYFNALFTIIASGVLSLFAQLLLTGWFVAELGTQSLMIKQLLWATGLFLLPLWSFASGFVLHTFAGKIGMVRDGYPDGWEKYEQERAARESAEGGADE